MKHSYTEENTHHKTETHDSKKGKKTDGFKTHKQQHIHTHMQTLTELKQEEEENEYKPKQNHLSKCFDMKFIVIVIDEQH